MPWSLFYENDSNTSSCKSNDLLGIKISSLPANFPMIPIGHPDTMMSLESVRRAIEDFRVKPSDVMVATFPKTGTTLITWICHLLRTNGNHLDFDSIYEVIPWPTLSWDIGCDPNKQGSFFRPRVFKSHLRMASIYRGCKYIVTVRDPLKTSLSFYNFLVNAKKVPSLQNVDVSTFTRKMPFLKGSDKRGSIWDYYTEYHQLLDCPAVLILVYEDLCNENRTDNIRRIANFMDLENKDDEKIISKVASMSTKEYMKGHKDKFEEPYERAKSLGRVGDLSQLAPGDKVAFNSHLVQMDDAGKKFLLQKWGQNMVPLGYSSYEEFVEVIRTKNRQRFGY